MEGEMQVNLDDNSNINVEKTDNADEFILSLDNRVNVRFSRSELKFMQALIDSALKEDDVMSREALQQSLKEAVEKCKPQLQLILRNMKTESIAHAVWYIDEPEVTEVILSNISKRSAEDVQIMMQDGIERRIRKERSEGNKDIEEVIKEHGRQTAASLLKKILSS